MERRTTGRSSPAHCPKASSSSTSTTPSSISKTPSTPPTGPTPPPPRRSSRSIVIGCAMSLMGSTASFGTLVYLRSKSPGNERIAQVLGYFRGNRHRMGYADAKARGLPIGSGVVEAACQNAGHRTAQALRHAMGVAWRASHSDPALARSKPPIRPRVDSARAIVSNTGVVS